MSDSERMSLRVDLESLFMDYMDRLIAQGLYTSRADYVRTLLRQDMQRRSAPDHESR